MTDASMIRVLIVEADDAVRSGLLAFLEDYGFDVSACPDAEEARDLMKAAPFHVCIVDPELPGFNGEELILLASTRFLGQKYIIHTSSVAYTLTPELDALGIRPEHVFRKPIRAPNLLVKLIKELTPQASDR